MTEPATTTEPSTASTDVDATTQIDAPDGAAAEQEKVAAVLAAEYGVLGTALGAAWSASLTRTSLFLFSLSASGVALGFAAQTGITEGPFRTFALVVLPIVIFIGVATFVRLVQVQREAVVYLIGMNRIRRFMVDATPAARRFLVLPVYDDPVSLYRSIGLGMSLRPPRYPLLHLVAQTQGMVGVVTGAVAAAGVGLLLVPVGEVVGWGGAAITFVAVVAVLFVYWQRSLRGLYASIRTQFPTPPEEIGAPF